jgi:ATP-dependent DNA helicase RecQ
VVQALSGDGRSTQTLALTATATPYVRSDIIQQLGLVKPETFVSGFDRPNLTIDVVHTEKEREKVARIKRLAKLHDGSGIIYAATRKAVEQVATQLQGQGLSVSAYHAGMGDPMRVKAQDDFMSGRTQMIVATNAFGMGIDKPDIRFVAHYQLPGSIEAYYQEIGRAGRDGLPSSCVLLFNYADKNTHDFFIEGSYPCADLVRDVYNVLLSTGLKRIELSAAEIAKRAGARNEMAIQSSLYLLERAGHIQRVAAAFGNTNADPPWIANTRTGNTGTAGLSPAAAPIDSTARNPSRRARSIVMLDSVPATKLRINPADVERRAGLERHKLRELIEFCYTEYCYRAHILDYFGDRHHARQCGSCGNCTPHSASRNPLSPEEIPDDLPAPGRKRTARIVSTGPVVPRALREDENLRVRKILACASRMKGRFGKNMLAATLRGSAAKNVMQARLNELSTYGLLKGSPQEETLAYVDALCAAGCLRVSPGAYPTVSITDLGNRVMREQERIELALPEDVKVIDEDDGLLPQTALQTYTLFRNGNSIAEIASQRNLVTNTIEGHLIDCMSAGLAVDISRLVSESDRAQIEKAIAEHGAEKLKPIHEALPESITYNMIRFVVAQRKAKAE